MTIYITKYGLSIKNNQEYDLWSSKPEPYLHDCGDSSVGCFTGTLPGQTQFAFNYKNGNLIGRIGGDVVVLLGDCIPKNNEIVTIEKREMVCFTTKQPRYMFDKLV